MRRSQRNWSGLARRWSSRLTERKGQYWFKKLNHYRAREKPSTPKKSGSSRRKTPDVAPEPVEFSSEEEGEEAIRTPVYYASKSSRKEEASTSYSNTDTIEITPPRRSTRSGRNDTTQRSVATSRGSLYPDLSAYVTTRSNRSMRGDVNDAEQSYHYGDEFTDSDPDESVYEVENKSINTTFSLHGNADGFGENDVHSPATRSAVSRRSGKLNQTLRSKLDSSTLNHSGILGNSHKVENSWEEKQVFKTSRESCISTAILIVVGIFFLLLAAAYVYMNGSFLGKFMCWYTLRISVYIKLSKNIVKASSLI